jgi:hypothetical protein
MNKVEIIRIRYLRSPYEDLVEDACKQWDMVPYKWNGRTKKGTDCLHFAASVLDTLYGSEHSKDLASLPPDAFVHNKDGVARAVRHLMSTYDVERVEDIEAGDLVVSGKDGIPAHLMVASGVSCLWEATFPHVRKIGYGIFSSEKIVAVYRARDKSKWSRAQQSN